MKRIILAIILLVSMAAAQDYLLYLENEYGDLYTRADVEARILSKAEYYHNSCVAGADNPASCPTVASLQSKIKSEAKAMARSCYQNPYECKCGTIEDSDAANICSPPNTPEFIRAAVEGQVEQRVQDKISTMFDELKPLECAGLTLEECRNVLGL